MGPAAGEVSLDERVRAAVGGKVPGVALVVVGAEGVRARSAVGLADLVAQAPMRTDMAIPWFSMTKIATATAAPTPGIASGGTVLSTADEDGLVRHHVVWLNGRGRVFANRPADGRPRRVRRFPLAVVSRKTAVAGGGDRS
jgi:hypothetical protein